LRLGLTQARPTTAKLLKVLLDILIST